MAESLGSGCGQADWTFAVALRSVVVATGMHALRWKARVAWRTYRVLRRGTCDAGSENVFGGGRLHKLLFLEQFYGYAPNSNFFLLIVPKTRAVLIDE